MFTAILFWSFIAVKVKRTSLAHNLNLLPCTASWCFIAKKKEITLFPVTTFIYFPD